LLGTLQDKQKRLWRWVSLAIGSPMGNLEGGSSTRDFVIWMNGALGMKCLSLKRLSTDGLWGDISRHAL
jgi:hypothetical protein